MSKKKVSKSDVLKLVMYIDTTACKVMSELGLDPEEWDYKYNSEDWESALDNPDEGDQIFGCVVKGMMANENEDQLRQRCRDHLDVSKLPPA